MEVYIDDMLVKSLNIGDHLKHLQETFDILRKHNMKINREKCAFGVSSGKFLGFMVSQRGIEVNPNKIKAIKDIPDQLSSVKRVQRLTGRLTALSRSVFRSLEKCHHFFSLLKKKNNIEWTPGMLAGFEIFEKVFVKPFVTIKTKGRRKPVNLPSSLGGSGPYQKISEREVVDFLWENIICRFEIPKEIAYDNIPQFIGAKVTKFLENLKVKRITSSPYHPSAKGQAESTNNVIIQNLKKRLEAVKGKWLEELPGVLWAYRTMAKASTRDTHFSLVYGTEALIPVEVGEPTLTYFRPNKETNNEAMLVNLELLDVRRDLAHIRMAAQK
ncbi:uncharacterized protein [Nicotiana tomentosiformis]|uniref:uncharacterized protein n=1 Tax=Nicotiana tomentosiformis TaxID=4098 RepID=UPI00388C70CD